MFRRLILLGIVTAAVLTPTLAFSQAVFVPSKLDDLNLTATGNLVTSGSIHAGLLGVGTTSTLTVGSNLAGANGAWWDLTSGTRSLVAAAYNGDHVYFQSTGQPFHLGTLDAQPLYIGINDTTALTILNGGNVGIGTTTPDYPLTVIGGNGGSIRVQAGNAAWLSSLVLGPSGGRNEWALNSYPVSSAPDYRFTIGNSYDGGNPAITILAASKLVGLNMTDPTARLHLPAGTTAANTAPLKFSPGAVTTVPEAGTIEYTSGKFWMRSDAIGLQAKVSGVGSQSAFDLSPTVYGSNYAIGQECYTTIATASGNVSVAAQLFIDPLLKTGTNAIGTAYGLYIDTQTIGSTNWSLYCAGAGSSYFGGPVINVAAAYFHGGFNFDANNKASIVPAGTDGGLSINYSNGGKGSLIWYGGGTTPLVTTNSNGNVAATGGFTPTPMAAASAPNNTIFVEVTTGALSYKGTDGATHVITTIP